MKLKTVRPTRQALGGLSPSEFKTLLKLHGHKVCKNFYRFCCSEFNNRFYRWRWWDSVVDVSEPREQFDRWANSTESIKPLVPLVHVLRDNAPSKHNRFKYNRSKCLCASCR